MQLRLPALVISAAFMVAIGLEEGIASAYDTATWGLFCTNCLLLGNLLGWLLLRIPAGRYCLDLVFWRLVFERRPN